LFAGIHSGSRERQASASHQRRGRRKILQRTGSAGLQDTGPPRASAQTATRRDLPDC